jgi:capsular polysaccharide biosynthesis protein
MSSKENPYDPPITAEVVGNSQSSPPRGCSAGPRLRGFPWRVSIGLGIVLAILGAAGMWFGWGPTYESTAYLRVRPQERTTLFSGAETPSPPDLTEFNMCKATQQQLIKSRFVLSHALRSPDVLDFTIDQRQADPATWLSDEVQVYFPANGEIMAVSMVSRDGKEAQALVQAVVDAYLSQVVPAESNQRRLRLDQLERIHTEHSARMRARRNELQELAERLGTTANQKELSLKQQVAIDQFNFIQRQQMQTEFDLRKAKSELDTLKALLQGIDEIEVSDFEIEQYLKSDPVVNRMVDELLSRRHALQSQMRARTGSESAFAKNAQRDLQLVNDEYNEHLKELRERVRQSKKTKVEEEKLKKEMEVASLTAQLLQLGREVEERRKRAERLSNSSVDLDMARLEIEQLQKTADAIAVERERLQVDVNSPPRVTLVQRASLPEGPSNTEARARLAVVTAAILLCLPMGCVILVRVGRRVVWLLDRL